MNLHQQFERELGNLGSGSAGTLAATNPPRTLTCDIVERNPLAVSFNQLRLTHQRIGVGRCDSSSSGSASRWRARLTYLMEPISPIEFDAEGCVVQLRSNPPQRDDDGRSYLRADGPPRRRDLTLAISEGKRRCTAADYRNRYPRSAASACERFCAVLV